MHAEQGKPRLIDMCKPLGCEDLLAPKPAMLGAIQEHEDKMLLDDNHKSQPTEFKLPVDCLSHGQALCNEYPEK